MNVLTVTIRSFGKGQVSITPPPRIIVVINRYPSTNQQEFGVIDSPISVPVPNLTKIAPVVASGKNREMHDEFVHTLCIIFFSITSKGKSDDNLYPRNSPKHVLMHKDMP